MLKRILFLTLIASFLMFAVSAYPAKVQRAVNTYSVKAPQKFAPMIGGNEAIRTAPYIPGMPGIIASSPGDTAGFTQYEFQCNGSTGNRIADDATGGIHVAWMNSPDYAGGLREVDYNYYDPIAHQWAFPGIGTDISYRNRDGYCQISTMADGRAVVAYHNGTNDSLFCAVNTYAGAPGFDYYHPLMRFGNRPCMWPSITVDRNGRIHMVAADSTNFHSIIGYTRSSNGGATWLPVAAVDTVPSLSQVIASSPVSDKVAMAYMHSSGTNRAYCDLYYVLSNDGVTWDFANGKVNVTNYGTGGDSLWGYTDCDLVFDYNDNLHFVWTAWYVGADSGLYFNQRLLHYDISSGTISTVTVFDSTWYDTQTWCAFGAWDFGICKVSIGTDPMSGALFTTYTSWTIADCALDGFANGDIFMSYSTDHGTHWTMRGNLTDSHTDSCEAGNCDSDNWSSLAEKVDSKLNIFYVNDKDAGAVVQSEGSVTDNPMLYLGYPNPVRRHAIPDAPRPSFPYNDSTFNSGYFLFDWNDPVGVMHYVLQIASEPSFTAPLVFEDSVSDYSEMINHDSLVAGVYFWRVKGVGLYGDSPWSQILVFSTAGSPSGSGYISGYVHDSGNAPITNVIATAYDAGNQIVGVDTSSALGLFVLSVPAGTYHAVLRKAGLGDATVNDIVIVMDSIKTIDVTMQPSGPSCNYHVGDVNNSGALNGLDVTYSVGYFKGGPPPPYSCECTAGHTWYVAGDVNASCSFNGLDVTYMVGYFKGGPAPHPCADCPPTP